MNSIVRSSREKTKYIWKKECGIFIAFFDVEIIINKKNFIRNMVYKNKYILNIL